MTTLLIRAHRSAKLRTSGESSSYGYRGEINLSTVGNGVYNIARYAQGVPETLDEYQTPVCTDTITFNIVGKSSLEVASAIAEARLMLERAVDFYNKRSHTAYYLDAKLPGDPNHYYAAIVNYTLHELNDPYDFANGGIVQDAVLTIVRDPWSNVPPQTTVFGILDPQANDVTYNNEIPLTLYELQSTSSTTGKSRPLEVPMPPYVGRTEAAILNNAIRAFPVNALHFSTSGPNHFRLASENELQRTPMPPPGPGMVFYVGSVGKEANKFSGIHFELERGIDSQIYNIDVAFWNGTAWIGTTPIYITDYLDVDREGQVYIGWNSTAMEAWQPGGVNPGSGDSSYYIRITISTPTPYEVPAIIKSLRTITSPSTPYVDILDPPGGDLPARLLIKIGALMPWESNAPIATNPAHGQARTMMDSVIIASEKIVYPGFTDVDPGFGFYSTKPIDDFSEYYQGGHVPPELKSEPFAVPVTSSYWTTKTDIGALPTNVYSNLAWITVPARPGVYRAFVRYQVLVPSSGRFSLRISTKPGWEKGYYESSSLSSASFGIDLDNVLNAATTCLADLGSISFSPRALQSPVLDFAAFRSLEGLGLDMTIAPVSMIPITVEGRRASGASGTILIYDLILLPLNDHYAVFEGGRGPLQRNSIARTAQWRYSLGLPDYQMETLMEEFLYINSINPGRTRAYIARKKDHYPIYPWPVGSPPHQYREISQDFASMGSPQMLTDARDARRFWFLWYKRIGDGIVWSYTEYKTRVEMFAAKQYLSIPAGDR